MLDLPRSPAEWTFVGRKDALDFALRELEAGRPGVVITGPAGAGRTRLAQEIARAATARGLATAWLSSAQLEDPAVLAGLEASHAQPQPAASLLVADDAHALAPAAARSIERIARRGGVFVVLTMVSGRRIPEAIGTLWKEGIAPLVELHPLAEAEVAELVESALAARAERGTVRLLWRASEGNLVLLRELLREGLHRGVLERRAGVWRWSGPLVLSAALRELALERVAALPEPARRTLEEIASTEPVELALLGPALEALSFELLEREGLVEIERDGRRRHARVVHPLCAEAVRQATPRSRLARIHRDFGSSLVRFGLRRADDRLRAAILLVEGDPAAAEPFLVDAADQAWSRGEYEVAERLARAALHGSRAVEARYVLGKSLQRQGRFDEANAEWERLEAMELDPALRERVAWSRAPVLAFARGRSDEARAVLDRTAASAASGEPTRSLDVLQATIGLAVLPPERIIAKTEQLLHEPGLAPRAEASALNALFFAANALGHFQRVLDERERALRAARSCAESNPNAELWIQLSSFLALLFTGALDAAEQLAAEQREARAGDAAATTRAYWTFALGMVALWRGRVQSAAGHLREAATGLLDYDNGARQLALFELVTARSMAGAVEEAEQALRDAEAARAGLGSLFPVHAWARAFTVAARGERSAAREICDEAARRLLADGRTLLAILALHDALRFGDGLATARALRSAAARTDGPLLRALADFGFALASRDAPALDAVSERLASLGVNFHAAEAARAACEHHTNAGRTAAALASRHVFEELAARCEGAAFAPLVAGDPLTRREREIAELAAHGASDREIARRLSISVRTVNAHLRSVYEKLGVAGRQALQALLAPPRGDPRTN